MGGVEVWIVCGRGQCEDCVRGSANPREGKTQSLDEGSVIADAGRAGGYYVQLGHSKLRAHGGGNPDLRMLAEDGESVAV